MADWASMRLARTPQADSRYHGQAGAQRPRRLSVSAIETYLSCPFKFFAQYVLRLEEEPDDDEVMDPRKQGQFIHEVFQTFFSTWHERGHHAITPDNLDTARALFADIVEGHLARVPEAEAALERTRLLGSSVAAGLGEVVFRMEAERPVDVVERLLEYELDGEFELAGPDGPRRIALRGMADRLDLLADGTFRLIDYKLSSAPNKSRALQLPIYGVCAEQRLACTTAAAGRSARRRTSRSAGPNASTRCSPPARIATRSSRPRRKSSSTRSTASSAATSRRRRTTCSLRLLQLRGRVPQGLRR